MMVKVADIEDVNTLIVKVVANGLEDVLRVQEAAKSGEDPDAYVAYNAALFAAALQLIKLNGVTTQSDDFNRLSAFNSKLQSGTAPARLAQRPVGEFDD